MLLNANILAYYQRNWHLEFQDLGRYVNYFGWNGPILVKPFKSRGSPELKTVSVKKKIDRVPLKNVGFKFWRIFPE